MVGGAAIPHRPRCCAGYHMVFTLSVHFTSAVKHSKAWLFSYNSNVCRNTATNTYPEDHIQASTKLGVPVVYDRWSTENLWNEIASGLQVWWNQTSFPGATHLTWFHPSVAYVAPYVAVPGRRCKDHLTNPGSALAKPSIWICGYRIGYHYVHTFILL